MSGISRPILMNQPRRRSGPGTGDAPLLDRFVRLRDEAAFAELVRRHGPMVRGVCQQMLRQPADADDAFQAVFLALVRLAPTIRRGSCLRSWLYQVAFRTCRRLRQARRASAPFPRGGPAAPVPGDALAEAEAAAVVHAEVQRLPRHLRLAVELCYLAGRSTADAARELGCPRGTVLSRLGAARRLLRERLTARGLALSAGLVALTRAGGGGYVTASVVEATTRAAAGVAAGEAAGPAAGLMEESFPKWSCLFPLLFWLLFHTRQQFGRANLQRFGQSQHG